MIRDAWFNESAFSFFWCLVSFLFFFSCSLLVMKQLKFKYSLKFSNLSRFVKRSPFHSNLDEWILKCFFKKSQKHEKVNESSDKVKRQAKGGQWSTSLLTPPGVVSNCLRGVSWRNGRGAHLSRCSVNGRPGWRAVRLSVRSVQLVSRYQCSFCKVFKFASCFKINFKVNFAKFSNLQNSWKSRAWFWRAGENFQKVKKNFFFFLQNFIFANFLQIWFFCKSFANSIFCQKSYSNRAVIMFDMFWRSARFAKSLQIPINNEGHQCRTVDHPKTRRALVRPAGLFPRCDDVHAHHPKLGPLARASRCKFRSIDFESSIRWWSRRWLSGSESIERRCWSRSLWLVIGQIRWSESNWNRTGRVSDSGSDFDIENAREAIDEIKQ